MVGVPWTLDLGDHREIPGVAVTPVSSFDQNAAALDSALANGSVFCAATHYWELQAPSRHSEDGTVGEHLERLIDRAMTAEGVVWRAVGDIVADAAATL